MAAQNSVKSGDDILRGCKLQTVAVEIEGKKAVAANGPGTLPFPALVVFAGTDTGRNEANYSAPFTCSWSSMISGAWL